MAGTVSQTIDRVFDYVRREPILQTLTFSVTADADDGSIPATAISAENLKKLAGWYLYQVKTVPGDTQPTAAYDITLTDGDSVDIAGGLLANRSASAAEIVQIAPSSGSHPLNPSEGLTLNIAMNSVHSAQITVKLTFVR